MELLWDLGRIASIAIVVIYLCERLKVSVVAAYLITGVILGPKGLALVKDQHSIEQLSEIGVMLLLFTIGLEFSFKQLSVFRNLILIGGFLYMLFSFVLGLIIFPLFITKKSFVHFLSLLATLSSTAIVLKILQTKMKLDSPLGKISFSMLLFQDIAFVPILVILPVMANSGQFDISSFLLLGFKAMALVVLTILGSRYVVPKIMDEIAKTRLRELFLLALLSIFLLTTWVVHLLHLPLGLGSFLAGLMLAETEYSHQALADFLPFKDIFTSIFFIAIGMLVDPSYISTNYFVVLKVILLILMIKFFAGLLSTLSIKYPLSTALLVGAYLCQMGEFSFMVGLSGVSLGLISREEYNLFLAASVASMMLAPFIIDLGEKALETALSKPKPSKLLSFSLSRFGKEESREEHLTDHVIIVGFGFTGRNVAKVCRMTNTPYIIVEMNPETVRKEKAKEPIVFGDATREPILEYAKVNEARAVVISVPDPLSAQNVVELVKRMAPFVKVIVRNRYVSRHLPLKEIGADEVVTEEYESALAILRILMIDLGVPLNKIEEFLSQIKAEDYRFLQTPVLLTSNVCDITASLPDLEIRTWSVTENSGLSDKTIEELQFRTRYGLNILGIKGKEGVVSNPLPSHRIRAGDVLILAGTAKDYSTFMEGLGKSS